MSLCGHAGAQEHADDGHRVHLVLFLALLSPSKPSSRLVLFHHLTGLLLQNTSCCVAAQTPEANNEIDKYIAVEPIGLPTLDRPAIKSIRCAQIGS
jgi:hypothetical protein